MTHAVFAVPGDITQRTGGYIYDATVLGLLPDIGAPVAHLELPASFPAPTPSDMDQTFALLGAVPQTQPILIDGLALGAMTPERVATLAAPIIALVHHPLGLETGLTAEEAEALLRNERAVLRHVDHVIVTSPHIAATLARDFAVSAERITIATPGFDVTPAAPAPVDPPLILSVGLLSPRKGHDTLIEALAHLADLPWQVEIIGREQDPAYTRRLHDLIAGHGLGGRIRLTGEIEAVPLADAYRRASLFALATRYEGYGMVLGEAMLHGLPIVSCDVGAVRSTVEDAAMLVPPDDPARFADALRSLLVDPAAAEAARRASRERGASLPTWADTTRIIAAVIEKVTPI